MKRKSLLSFIFVLVIALSLIQAPGEVEGAPEPTSDVTSLVLEADGDEVEWDVEGYSSSGFKVVWSKNKNPEYPLREGDKYNYHSNPEDDESDLTAFDGPGTYYVRVCEYLGGKCGMYSNEVEVVLEGEDDDEYEEKEEEKEEYEEKVCCFLSAVSRAGGPSDSYQFMKKEECNSSERDSLGRFMKIVDNSFCPKEEYEYKEKYEYEGENGEKVHYEYEYEGKKEGFVPIEYGGDQECQGCLIEGECVPICYRKAGVYCSFGGELVNQSEEGAVCDNSCECESNVCAGGECVSAGTIQKILNFFRNLFG